MYPQFVIDLIKGYINQFTTRLGQEIKEKNGIVSKIDSPNDVVWKHETIKEKTVTIVKCIQKSSEDGHVRVNLTFNTIHVDLCTWRCIFLKGTSGKKTFNVRDIQILLSP
ncbi:unnamed protein product [Rotaria sp. Silwood1]|nr:unnamed protein product [Rotaria sp. Silwood1]CAF4987483.1 unnamed protein product [Rotaria sp. Silwood1]